MKLTNLELNGTLLFTSAGETKSVVMTTDADGIPYSAYYVMPNGYVSWLSVTVVDNVFAMKATSNLFSETSRSVVVSFRCMPTAGGTLQTTNVTVTQAADTVALTFDPTQVSLAYDAGATDDVTVTGIPSGAIVTVSAPEWLTAAFSSATTLAVTAALNVSEDDRVGTVTVGVDGRSFYLTVTQAANTSTITFDPTEVSLAYSAGATDDVTITGIPSGASVTVSAPEWLTASVLAGVLTLTATENPSGSERTGTVNLVVVGKTWPLTVAQAKNPFLYGPLTLDEQSYDAPYSGGSVTVTATAMPSNASTFSIAVKRSGSCTACEDSENVITFEQLSATSVKIIVGAQDLFDGIERGFTLTFTAGNETATFTITQEAPDAYHRYYGVGDKFLRSAVSEKTPTYLAPSTVQQLLAELKTTGWTQLESLRAPVLVATNLDSVPKKILSHEAFKACHGHTTVDGTTFHQVSMGAAVYRFIFDPAAYGLVLKGIRFIVRSDAYCAEGLRVALDTTSTSDTPSEDWLAIREGTAGFFKPGCAPRVLRDAGYYGASETVVFSPINVTISAETRLYLYLTLEDYRGIINGWVYGSGLINPVFDFFAADEDTVEGVENYDTIAQSAIQKDGYPLVTDGTVLSPMADPANPSEGREIAIRAVNFGTSPSKNDPTPVEAASAIAFLAARIAESGMAQADLSATPITAWQAHQFGLGCAICRQIIGATAPFSQRLIQTVSPLAVLCALPPNYTPAFVRLTHRAGQATFVVSGADVRLSVYWIASKAVTLKELGDLYAAPAFSLGESKIEGGGMTAELLGSKRIPSSVAALTEVAIEIVPPSARWGTLLIVPWIARVTATSLVANEPIGLVGIEVLENEIAGTAWVPDVKLEA
jgi:hypothetical protein